MNTNTPVHEEKFSPLRFLVINAVTLMVIVEMMKVILQWMSLDTLWQVQTHSAWWKVVVVFVVGQAANCFAEWFFHRYMLHSPLVPGFSRLFVQHHRIHHMLTNVQPVPVAKTVKVTRAKQWKNNYPIREERQYEASYFPDYSFAAFAGFALVVIIPIQALASTWPVLLVSVVSILWSLVMYEFIHAVDHLPMAFWEWIFKQKFIGGLGQRMYAFHLTHHEYASRFKWNQNISGFLLGIPLADWVFGTLKLPKEPFLHGTLVRRVDTWPPRPRFKWIHRLDEVAGRKVTQFRL